MGRCGKKSAAGALPGREAKRDVRETRFYNVPEGDNTHAGV
jgi:hypothetical protein